MTWPCPLPSGVAPVQRGEDSLGREHPGQRVAQRDVDPRRRLAGKAVDVAEPAHRLGDGREPARSAYGPVCPYPETRARTSPGFDLLHPLEAEVPALERPGPEVLDDDVRAADKLEQKFLPALGARFSVTHFLLRDWTGHQSERPS